MRRPVAFVTLRRMLRRASPDPSPPPPPHTHTPADATVASAEGVQWVQARGYTLNGTTGYVFPAGAAVPPGVVFASSE